MASLLRRSPRRSSWSCSPGLVGYIAYTGSGHRHARHPGPRAPARSRSSPCRTPSRAGRGHRQRQEGARARHGRGPAQAARHLPRQPGAAPPAGAGAERGAEPARRHLEPQQDPRRDAVAGGAAAGGARSGAVRHLQVQHVGHRPLRPDRRSSWPTSRACSASSCRTISRWPPTNSQAAKALGDTSGSLLEAKFQVRTFVKSSSSGRRGQWHVTRGSGSLCSPLLGRRLRRRSGRGAGRAGAAGRAPRPTDSLGRRDIRPPPRRATARAHAPHCHRQASAPRGHTRGVSGHRDSAAMTEAEAAWPTRCSGPARST